MTESEHFETEYFKTLAKINTFLSNNSQVLTAQQTQGASNNNVHLPQLKLCTLKSLKVPVAIINTKLDYTTKKNWEHILLKAKLNELKCFIEKRCQFLESVFAKNRSQFQSLFIFFPIKFVFQKTETVAP
jgi:hypothetical protein